MSPRRDSADTELASDCRAHFGRALTREVGCRISCVAVQLPVRWCGEDYVLVSKCECPPFRYPRVKPLVAHDCGYPLSRYTCRATHVAADSLDFIAFCRCSTGVALHPLKILVSHLPPPPVPGGVAPKFGCLKRCRATRGCRSYSCGCRATLCN